MASVTIPNSTQNYYPYTRVEERKSKELFRTTIIPVDKTMIVVGDLTIADRDNVELDIQGELILL